MCILFIYTGNSENSDYSFILASNRDEHYDRPAANAAPWLEDPNVIGGRDMEKGREGGSWLALSPARRRIGVLLNLSGNPKQNPKGRGNIVADFVKSEIPAVEYVKSLQPFAIEFNDFNLVTIEIGEIASTVQSYSNVTDTLQCHDQPYLGFGNSLPELPLKKVESGKHRFEDICKRWHRAEHKECLLDDLFALLKWNERHLPDPELMKRCPGAHEALSSVYVNIPEGRYGTRTHTIILISKTGRLDFIEATMQPPVDPQQPSWQLNEYQFNI